MLLSDPDFFMLQLATPDTKAEADCSVAARTWAFVGIHSGLLNFVVPRT